MSEPEAIPAATLILMREAADGGMPEILMVERAKAMAFAGGAMVFPGGRVDAGDRVLAEAIVPEDAEWEIAARIAAMRETVEEAGIAVGLTPGPDAATVATLRRRLHAGEAVGAVLGDLDLAFDPAAMVPFARWLPKGVSHRVFDTRFYIAGVPDGAEARVDGSENVRLAWYRAQEVLDAADQGRLEIIFPTRRNLERLALFASLADATAQALAYPVRTITPWIEMRDGKQHLCIPHDAGYPVTSEPMGRVRRA